MLPLLFYVEYEYVALAGDHVDFAVGVAGGNVEFVAGVFAPDRGAGGAVDCG